MVKRTENGKFYDVEMQVSNERNIPKRMRFYQAALDISFLDKSNSYNNLTDSFIIFICTFDAIGKNRPVYTFENTKDKELKDFLTYLKTGKASSEFTRGIGKMIQTVKQSEQARQEYRLISISIPKKPDTGKKKQQNPYKHLVQLNVMFNKKLSSSFFLEKVL